MLILLRCSYDNDNFKYHNTQMDQLEYPYSIRLSYPVHILAALDGRFDSNES